MSRTFSSCSRERSWKGSEAVTRRLDRRRPRHSSSAAIETRCWASTSSGFCGITVSSISPARMRLATTAHSSRSARNLGKIRPRETSPSEWPARPTRCSPRLTDFGDSTWITRSTAPMSIPSSRDEVATRHGSCPDFSISSTTVRSSWDRDPWWARAISTGPSALAGPAEEPRLGPSFLAGPPRRHPRAACPPCSVAGSSPFAFAVRPARSGAWPGARRRGGR